MATHESQEVLELFLFVVQFLLCYHFARVKILKLLEFGFVSLRFFLSIQRIICRGICIDSTHHNLSALNFVGCRELREF